MHLSSDSSYLLPIESSSLAHMPRRDQPPDSISNIRRKKNVAKEKKEKRKQLLEHIITHGIDPVLVNIVKGSSSSPSVFDRLQPIAQSSQPRIVIEVTPPAASTSSSVEQPGISGPAAQHRQVIELSSPPASDDVTSPPEIQQQRPSVFERLGSSTPPQEA